MVSWDVVIKNESPLVIIKKMGRGGIDTSQLASQEAPCWPLKQAAWVVLDILLAIIPDASRGAVLFINSLYHLTPVTGVLVQQKHTELWLASPRRPSITHMPAYRSFLTETAERPPPSPDRTSSNYPQILLRSCFEINWLYKWGFLICGFNLLIIFIDFSFNVPIKPDW